jgi:hypothetical protein
MDCRSVSRTTSISEEGTAWEKVMESDWVMATCQLTTARADLDDGLADWDGLGDGAGVGPEIMAAEAVPWHYD